MLTTNGNGKRSTHFNCETGQVVGSSNSGGRVDLEVGTNSPVDIHKIGINIDIFADSGLVLSAPLTGSLATHLMKCASKVVHRFKADHGSDLFERVARELDEMLRFLDAVSQQIAAGRDSERFFEVLPDVAVGSPDNLGNVDYAEIRRVMFPDELRRLLNNPVPKGLGMHGLDATSLFMSPGCSKMQQHHLGQERAA